MSHETSPPARGKTRWTSRALYVLLVAIALLGPMVAFAGISVIYPSSQTTVDVNESPPVTFSQGSDHTDAQSLGYAGSFAADDNGASYTVTLNGLSGGTITVDDLVNVTRTASVSSYKLEIATALSGDLSPTTLKLRLWTGDTAPTADGDGQVCAVLDLTAALDTETATSCALSSKMQLVLTLPSSQTTESATVSIRPSSIVTA